MFGDLEKTLSAIYREAPNRWHVETDEPRLQRTRSLLRRHSPPSEPGAYLLVLRRGVSAFWFRLHDETTIGRSAERNRLTLAHPWISRTHGKIRRDGLDWLIEDTGARNGMKINGQTKAKHVLRDGDAIHVGIYLLLFIVA